MLVMRDKSNAKSLRNFICASTITFSSSSIIMPLLKTGHTHTAIYWLASLKTIRSRSEDAS